MMWVGCTPIAGVPDLDVDIADRDVFKQQRKDEFDMHFVLKILHGKFRFLKKAYFLDSQENNIKKIKFEMSEKGCGTASIEFDFIDTYIQPEDIVQIYALDTLMYQGRVLTIADKKVEVQPARAKLSLLRYRGKFDKFASALDIIETILDERNLDSGVTFSKDYIDNTFYSKMELYYLQSELEIDYELLSDVIDKIITDVDSDAAWGVNEQGVFFVKYPEDSVSQFFYKTGERSDYGKITIAESWDDIEYTRAAVTRAGRKYSDEEKEKDTTLIDEEDTVFCGLVGYESSANYPPLPNFENLVGKKEALIHLSTMLTAENTAARNRIALDYAYTMIKSQSTEQKITLTKVPFRPDMSCGQKVYVQAQNKSFKVLSDCSSIDGWSNAELVTGDSVSGDTHIKGCGDLYFSLVRETEYPEQEFFVFFVRFYCQDFFTVQFRDKKGQPVFERKYQVVSRSWQQLTIPYKKSFCSIKFTFPAPFWLDMLQVYCRNDKTYNFNVNKITTTISSGIGLSQVELGSKDVTVNDRLQYLEWKFKQIEKINSI